MHWKEVYLKEYREVLANVHQSYACQTRRLDTFQYMKEIFEISPD